MIDLKLVCVATPHPEPNSCPTNLVKPLVKVLSELTLYHKLKGSLAVRPCFSALEISTAVSGLFGIAPSLKCWQPPQKDYINGRPPRIRTLTAWFWRPAGYHYNRGLYYGGGGGI